MKFSRRDFLKLGGVTLIAVGGGSVFRAVDQGVFSVGRGPAYEPWTNWRNADSPIERIVAAGILASNPHNSQPWKFRITASTIDLFAVPERQIGVIDPFRREMYIGLGCAVETMKLAAEAEGFSADIRLMPDPQEQAPEQADGKPSDSGMRHTFYLPGNKHDEKFTKTRRTIHVRPHHLSFLETGLRPVVVSCAALHA